MFRDRGLQLVNYHLFSLFVIPLGLGFPYTKSIRLRKVDTNAKKTDVFKNLE